MARDAVALLRQKGFRAGRLRTASPSGVRAGPSSPAPRSGVRLPAGDHARVPTDSQHVAERTMTQNLFILNDAPYGTERSYNALRVAGRPSAKRATRKCACS